MNVHVNSARLRELNDSLRQTFSGGQILLTSGVAALGDAAKAHVLQAIRTFSTFDKGNDPHEEHDFGSVEVEGQVYLFKIDYYDLDMRYLSDDPSDPAHTKRVMTVMCSDEY